MSVEPRRDHHEIRSKIFCDILESGLEHPPLLRGERVCTDRYVHRGAQTATMSGLAATAGSGVPRVLMHREKINARVVVKDTLGPVAVMDIPVDDGDAVDLFIAVLRVFCGDGDVIKKAKPHGPLRGCMMARRS